jgi:hypothetical protein
MDARGLTEADLVEGARRSTMDELAQATATGTINTPGVERTPAVMTATAKHTATMIQA